MWGQWRSQCLRQRGPVWKEEAALWWCRKQEQAGCHNHNRTSICTMSPADCPQLIILVNKTSCKHQPRRNSPPQLISSPSGTIPSIKPPVSNSESLHTAPSALSFPTPTQPHQVPNTFKFGGLSDSSCVHANSCKFINPATCHGP
jgi:hypothetical protein